jgi:hypothetical protein
LESVDNVPFRGGSYFHKTKFEEGKRLFGLGVGPTLSHVQNKTILRLLCSILGWDLESFTKQKKSKNNRT